MQLTSLFQGKCVFIRLEIYLSICYLWSVFEHLLCCWFWKITKLCEVQQSSTRYLRQ